MQSHVRHRFTEKFEADGGFRLYRDRISVLGQALSFGQRLSSQGNTDLALSLDAFFDAIAREKFGPDPSFDQPRSPIGSPLTRVDFPELTPNVFYKFISQETWEYIRDGSFQFGTPEFYRTTPNIHIRDRREGFGHFHLVAGDQQLNVSLLSGFNCLLFCGTGTLETANDTVMRQRFGPKCIRIDGLQEFIGRARLLLKANRARTFDVRYRDVQSLIETFPEATRVREITGTGDLTLGVLRQLNTEMFMHFYEFGFFPGVCVKPLTYSVENERRIVFEVGHDKRPGPVPITDRKLLKHVTLLN